MSQCHVEGAQSRDRHYELYTMQRGGDDLEDLSQAFGTRAERDQGPGGEVSRRALPMRLDAQELFFGSVDGSPSIHFAEANQTAHGARPCDRLEE
jgi:hypothetical protein